MGEGAVEVYSDPLFHAATSFGTAGMRMIL
jgi:hypothetical protein